MEKRFPLYFSVLFFLFGSGLFISAYFGNFDGSEAWYSNDIYLLTRGEKPYIDFFYHRLPLFLYSYFPLNFGFEMTWFNLRLVSAFYAFCAFIVLFLVMKVKVDKRFVLLGALLFLLNFHGLHIYSTVQSYSIVSLIYLLVIFSCHSSVPSLLSGIFIAVCCATAQWMRYPIDYLPIVYLSFVFVFYRKSWPTLICLLLIYCFIHLVYFYFFKSDFFIYDVLLGMAPIKEQSCVALAQVLTGRALDDWLRFKWDQWIVLGVRWFFPFFIFGMPAFGYWLKKNGLGLFFRKIIQDKRLFLSLFFVFGNTAMNFIASEGHVVQMYFVFPIMIYLFIRLLNAIMKSIPADVKQFVTLILLFLILFSSFLFDRFFELDKNSRDIAVAEQVGKIFSSHCDSSQILFTFNPIIAFTSKMRVFSGAEFDVFGYYPNLSPLLARKYHLLTQDDVLRGLKEFDICGVYLDARVFGEKHSGVRLRAISKEIIDITKSNFDYTDYSTSYLSALRGPVAIGLKKNR